jgi:hypothetical protein
MPKKRLPDKLQMWIDARKKYHLTHAQVQMARELGMNPKTFGKIANQRQEPWKLPLPKFIEDLYLKRFRRYQPERVVSIEELAENLDRKKEERKLERQRFEEPGTDEPTEEEDTPSQTAVRESTGNDKELQ